MDIKFHNEGTVQFFTFDGTQFLRMVALGQAVWYSITDTGFESLPNKDARSHENALQTAVFEQVVAANHLAPTVTQ